MGRKTYLSGLRPTRRSSLAYLARSWAASKARLPTVVPVRSTRNREGEVNGYFGRIATSNDLLVFPEISFLSSSTTSLVRVWRVQVDDIVAKRVGGVVVDGGALW